MTGDGLLRAALNKLLETEPCAICDGPLVLGIPAEGTPYARVYHDPDCPLAASLLPCQQQTACAPAPIAKTLSPHAITRVLLR